MYGEVRTAVGLIEGRPTVREIHQALQVQPSVLVRAKREERVEVQRDIDRGERRRSRQDDGRRPGDFQALQSSLTLSLPYGVHSPNRLRDCFCLPSRRHLRRGFPLPPESPDLTPRVARVTRNHVKQNVTISLDREIVRKAKILAARRATSISGLLAAQIEAMVVEDEAYQQAKRQALELLDRGFHLGGVHDSKRSDLHER